MWLYLLLALALVVVYYGFIKYKPFDWLYVFRLLAFLRATKKDVARGLTAVDCWVDSITRHGPDWVCAVFGRKDYTFGYLDKLSNQVAHFLLAHNFQKGDCLALCMTNRPEYVAFWLGAAKIGAVTALINHNLEGEPLLHSMKVSDSKLVICGGNKAKQVAAIHNKLQGVPVFVWHAPDDVEEVENKEARSDGEGLSSLNLELDKCPTDPVPALKSSKGLGITRKDPLLYVYTSGTTGLPKAAVITNSRFTTFGNIFGWAVNLKPQDRVYCCLPLYHSAGGLLGVGAMIRVGCPLVIRSKFSATRFWSDIRENNCTVFQYIGEICRYVLATPPSDLDGKHSVRAAFGNGLRAEVWQEFARRFNMPGIVEFYGATEGAGGLINQLGRVGACGYVNPLLDKIAPTAFVKFDHDAEQPIRHPNTGFCVRCDDDEVGEFLVRIETKNGEVNFEGYKDRAATSKKVIENVFVKGDKWFRTGDLLRKDKEGFVYFVDRIGDTFRWKGENVSTLEVAHVLSQYSPATHEPNVYGVQIPGVEGRAGMVAFASADNEKPLTPEDIDMERLGQYVKKNLPVYMVPLFVRVLNVMQVTGTFKHRKVELVKDGFDPSVVKEPLFFFDGKTYIPLTTDVYNGIVGGRVRM